MNQKLNETFYKVDDKDKISVMHYTVEGANYTKTWGDYTPNAKPTGQTRVVKGKNRGKANGTTDNMQAIKDATADIVALQDRGYVNEKLFFFPDGENNILSRMKWIRDSYHELLPPILPKPMLLYKALTPTFPTSEKERGQKGRYVVTFPCYVQPKLDGLCTVVTKKHYLSTRAGKLFHQKGCPNWINVVPHIVFELKMLYDYLEKIWEMPTIIEDSYVRVCYTNMIKHFKQYTRPMFDPILNGEMYSHGLLLQDIVSANKKQNEDSSSMHLHLFDLQLEGIQEVGRLEFMEFISSILTRYIDAKWIHVMPSYIVHDHIQLDNYLNDFINQGYEGAIVRLTDGQYYPEKRSRTVLKMVVMDFAEATVIDVIPMEKNPKLGKFMVRLADGQTMMLTPGLGYTEKIKQDLLTNKAKYIGTTVKYTHRGFSKEGIPRIAVAYIGKIEDEDGE